MKGELQEAFDKAIDMLHKFAVDNDVLVQGTLVVTDSDGEASVYQLDCDEEEDEENKPY